ncbi:MAG: CPBP family glutamic-type intramembrane protease [Promethearchaeota archaeon]|jgi:membrane protease YdiL (CAAX protease family)/predicted RNA-binding Zn-ribbon protein involved in translation (DUF1610 family)
MSKDNKKQIKFCVFCGEDVGESKTYCPNCGKLIVKLKSGKTLTHPQVTQMSGSIQKIDISRKCPECGSIISSTILNQCPICNTPLEKIPESKKEAIQKKPGLIFTNKKLEPEQKFVLKKDTWSLREGINVFGTCIYTYIIAFFLIYFLLIFQGDGGSIEQTIQLLLISQIPEIIFAIYPIYYIRSKNHSFRKIGFTKDSKKILTGILIGVIGAISLVFINLLYNTLINSLADIGLDFFNIGEEITAQTQMIRNTDLIWVILLSALMVVGTISLEIVFRGVLHNTLKQKFNNVIYVILIVSLAYSILMLALYPNPAYFLLNFIVFLILGILYELNGNLYNSIIASVIYTVTLLIFIYL